MVGNKGSPPLMETILKYKLMALYVLLFSLNALALAYTAAMTGQNWDDLSGTSRSIIIATIVSTWTNTMLALFNKTFAKMSNEPISGAPAPGETKPVASGDATKGQS